MTATRLRGFSSPSLVHHLVESYAKSAPNSVAISDSADSRSLTFLELNTEGNRVARRILALTKGRLEVPVALLIHNRADFVVACLAVLKAGCAFVPISPTDPAERILHILKELGAPAENNVRPILILGASKDSQKLVPMPTAKFSEFATILPFHSQQIGDSSNISLPALTSSNLAYIIYTSGSTGVPKGVMIEHGSILGRIQGLIKTHAFTSSDKTPLFLNPAFDASILECWATLGAGGSCVVVPDCARDPVSFFQFIQGHGITRTFLPAVFAARIWPLVGENSLKSMFVGGEQLTPFPFWRLSYQVINCYGPTEATVQVAVSVMNDPDRKQDSIKQWKVPPIGKAVPGVVLAPGNSGELWIGGQGLARGYWNNAVLTRDRFVFKQDGSRWYKTGDLVRQCPVSEEFTWLGRIDDQIKVNGFLIEPTEVEAVILTHLAKKVSGVKVVKIQDRLVAFVTVLSHEERLNLDPEILSSFLPQHMMPSLIIAVPSLPTTSNGKTDKTALIQYYNDFLNTAKPSIIENCCPLKSCESSIASLWSRVLKIPKNLITSATTFVQIGGNSLYSTEMGVAIQKEFGLDSLPPGWSVTNGLNLSAVAEFVSSKISAKSPAIQSPRKKMSSTALLPLFADNSLTPPGSSRNKVVLVFLHAEVGHLLGYNALVQRLATICGNLQLFGVQDESGACQFSSVHEMALEYGDILTQRFPPGQGWTFILAGFSFGGYLAWELASILRVPFLILFDVWSTGLGSKWELIRAYKASRRLVGCPGAPEQSLKIGAARFHLGLEYTPKQLGVGTKVLHFLARKGPQRVDKTWWNKYLPGGEFIYEELAAGRSSFLEEPSALEIAKIIKNNLDSFLEQS